MSAYDACSQGGELFFRVGPFNLIFSNCLFANFEIDIPIDCSLYDGPFCMSFLSLKGGYHAKIFFFFKFIFGFHWECRARGIFIIIFGRCFAGKKCCPKRPTATPTMRLPVAVKCGRGVT